MVENPDANVVEKVKNRVEKESEPDAAVAKKVKKVAVDVAVN